MQRWFLFVVMVSAIACASSPSQPNAMSTDATYPELRQRVVEAGTLQVIVGVKVDPPGSPANIRKAQDQLIASLAAENVELASRFEARAPPPKSRRRRRGARALAARLRFRVPKFLTSRGAVVLRWSTNSPFSRRPTPAPSPESSGRCCAERGCTRRLCRGGVVSDARAPWPLCAQRKGVGRQTRSIPWLRVSRSSSMRFAGSNKSSTMPRPSSTSKKNSPRCWGSQ